MNKQRAFRIDVKQARALWEAGLCDEEIAKKIGAGKSTVQSWRAYEGLHFNPAPKAVVSRVRPVDRNRQCKGCIFWRGAVGNPGEMHFCNHLLDTGKRRVEVDGVCQSKQIKEKRRRKCEQ